MAGNIHYPYTLAGRQIKGRKTQIDSDAALLFLLQAVGIDAGQDLY